MRHGARKALGEQLTYFDHAPKMRGASLNARRLAIGSGVTEGACKPLIATRAKRSGRWLDPFR